MTEITAPKSPVTTAEFADGIREQLKYSQGVTVEQATPADVYVASSLVVRHYLQDAWFKTQQDMVNGNTKAVGYLSAEFLMGKQLRNALLNAGMIDQFDEAVKDLGFEPQDVIDVEHEPGLGNGGLGRLAACFIDSLASLGVPAFGYGIQYKYGIFEQAFDKDGKQIEKPDYWLTNEEPWGHIDYNRSQKVSFGGEVVEENGKKIWKPAWSVRAVPVDYMVPGYASGRVNTLRLWSAKSYDEFDLLTFNKSEYLDAVKPQVKAENISKILYPEDSTPQGKALRLEQQYFFVAASLHDAIRVFYPGQSKPDLTTFPSKITFQLNDTHPVIGIPELMRILIDEYGYDWDTAWSITTKTFNYTCHTLLVQGARQSGPPNCCPATWKSSTRSTSTSSPNSRPRPVTRPRSSACASSPTRRTPRSAWHTSPPPVAPTSTASPNCTPNCSRTSPFVTSPTSTATSSPTSPTASPPVASSASPTRACPPSSPKASAPTSG